MTTWLGFLFVAALINASAASIVPSIVPPHDDLTSDQSLEAVHFETFRGEEANLSEVHFYLHTNQNPVEADELFIGNKEALQNSHFHIGGPLWVLVHGFGGGIGGSFPYETGIDLLGTNEIGNVILLDWSTLSEGPNYFKAVDNGYAVSNYTAEFLQFLVQEQVVTSGEIHIIGFSLGGQVVGILGKRFEWLTGEKVARITGLDPAWPLFYLESDDDKITADDAVFVDVIHTNGGTQGVIQPAGHVDFYPNGGKKQPGCGIDITGSCSHARAVHYFKETITSSNVFCGCKCESWEEFEAGNCACSETANLGYFVDQTATDNHYLTTFEESPYAQGPCITPA